MAHREVEEWDVLGAMWVIHGSSRSALLCVYANSVVLVLTVVVCSGQVRKGFVWSLYVY